MTDINAARIARIAEIDEWFKDAISWGSWMVDVANEREQLVDYLRREGVDIEHKHLARTDSGGRVS